MSDVPQGPGWWQASDGRYYPPQAPPSAPVAPPVGAAYGQAPGPYGQAPGPYGQAPAPYGFTNPKPQNNGKAVAALVCGISSLVLTVLCSLFLPFLALFPGAVAVVLGVIGRNEVNASGGRQDGAGMALAGIITGGIGVGLSVLLIVAFFTLWSSAAYY